MVKHGLGGDAVVTEAVRRNVVAVELLVRLGEERFLITRAIGSGSDVVGIAPADGSGRAAGEQQLVAAKGGNRESSISSFLMTRLEIPQLRFPRSTRDPDEDLTSVTFHDVYALMYLDQDQIDGAIGFEGARHQKWRQTFEVVYGLADAELAELRTQLGSANADHARVTSYVREIERFLEATGEASATLRERRERLVRERADLEMRLDSLRERSRAVQTFSKSSAEVADAERVRVSVRTELVRELAQLESLSRVRAQLDTDFQQVRRAATATELFSRFEFETCPRCTQDLPHDRGSATCRLCGQEEPELAPNLGAEVEMHRLERQVAETRELIEAAEARGRSQQQALARADAAYADARAAWDTRSREQTAPFLEQISALSERRGEVTNAIRELERAEKQKLELENARAEAERLRHEQRRLSEEISAAQGRLRQGHDALKALSEAYADVIESVEMPWAKTATIDRRAYVPLINGRPVRSLSSGGLKTIANFGFYLAQLQTALRGHPTHLPTLMVIDSPRKNFGSNESDADSMRRFYRSLWTLTQQRTGTQFQVIVADNDSPSTERNQFTLLPLDRDNPLVNAAKLRGTGQAAES